MRKVAMLLAFAVFSAGVISCGQVSSQKTYEGAAVGGAIGAAAGALLDKENSGEERLLVVRWVLYWWNCNRDSPKGCKGSGNG
jgi:gas vesicle protein